MLHTVLLNILGVLNITDLWKVLNLYIPEYKDYIIDEFGKNISQLDILLLLYFINDMLQFDTFQTNYRIKYYNVIYRKKFDNKFSGLYQIMKNFNLSALEQYEISRNGSGCLKFSLEWKGLYEALINDGSISATLLNFRDTGELPINYIYDGIPIDGFLVYVPLTMAFNKNFSSTMCSMQAPPC